MTDVSDTETHESTTEARVAALNERWDSPSAYLNHIAMVAKPKKYFVTVPLLAGGETVIVANDDQDLARLLKAGGTQKLLESDTASTQVVGKSELADEE